MRLSSLFSPFQWFSYLRSISVASFLLGSRFVSTNKKQHRMNLCWLRRMCKNSPDLWLCYFYRRSTKRFLHWIIHISGFRPVNCHLGWILPISQRFQKNEIYLWIYVVDIRQCFLLTFINLGNRNSAFPKSIILYNIPYPTVKNY